MDEIAEALRPPHTNLEKLTVYDFPGSNFPNWMMDPLFSNLVRVTLRSPPNCMQLPGLGKLLSLEYLKIDGMYKVTHIGSEFCGSSSEVSFPKLEKLIFFDMPNLEDWELTSERQLMPSLRQLRLDNCPKLNKFLPNSHFLSLKTLTLEGVNNKLLSEGLLPTLPNLNHLMIGDNKELTPIARGWLGQLKALEIFELSNCNALSCLPEELQSLTYLQKLKIRYCLQLEDHCKEGGEEWHKISHIPNIIIRDW